ELFRVTNAAVRPLTLTCSWTSTSSTTGSRSSNVIVCSSCGISSPCLTIQALFGPRNLARISYFCPYGLRSRGAESLLRCCLRTSATNGRHCRRSCLVAPRTLLGVGSLIMYVGPPRRESRGIEQREIHRRLAVDDPVGDVAAGRRRVLEAVAAEADGEEEAFDAGRPADDRVVVGGERAQSRPAAGDLRRLEHGHAVHRLVHGLVETAPVHRHLEVRADVLDVAPGKQDLL